MLWYSSFYQKNTTCQYVECFQYSKVFYKLSGCLTWEKGHVIHSDICRTWYTGYLSAFMGLSLPSKFQFEGKVLFVKPFYLWWCHNHSIWYYKFNKYLESLQYKIGYFAKHLYVYIYVYIFSTSVSIQLGPWLYSLYFWSLKAL